jgi:hypothetical protein
VTADAEFGTTAFDGGYLAQRFPCECGRLMISHAFSFKMTPTNGILGRRYTWPSEGTFSSPRNLCSHCRHTWP